MSGFEEAHDELRAVARDLLGKASGAADWAAQAEAGWLGLEVPEELGGAGATFAEVAIVLEERGRAVAPGPYLGTVVLGVGALGLLAPHPQRDGLLGRVASGDVRLAVAVADGDTDAVPGAPPFRIERPGGGLRLRGRAAFVPDAPDADRLLLVARDDRGPVVVALAPGAPGLDVAGQPVLDATRSLGLVTADGVALGDGDVWRFAGDAEASVRRLFDRAAVAVACDALGLAEAMLEATVAYAGVRTQFDRPIGSFQAVKHACADMLVAVTVSRELLALAVRAVATGDDGPAPAMAASHVTQAAVDVVGKALQLHGGIGYTWESGIHAYLKRAALDRSLFGSPRAHRRRLAARYPVAGP